MSLSQKEFIILAIEKLRGEKRGIHSVFSGFNDAFKKYFNGQDPAVSIRELESEGKIVLMPTRDGVMIYLYGDDPRSRQHRRRRYYRIETDESTNLIDDITLWTAYTMQGDEEDSERLVQRRLRDVIKQ